MTALLSFAFAAPCAGPTTSEDLNAFMAAAEASFAGMSVPAFQQSRDSAEQALTCLDEVILPQDAAAYHRMMALDAFIHDDAEGMLGAYHAALLLQPAYMLPSSYAPVGHPLRDAYGAASQLAPGGIEALDFGTTTLRVDGRPAKGLPTDRPAIAQTQSPDGSILWTAWLRPGDPLPYPIPAPTELPAIPLPAPPQKPVPWLAVGSATSLALAGGAWAYAAAQNQDFDDPDTPYEDLALLQTRANVSTGLAVGLGAVGIGLGSAALVVEF